MKAAAYIFDMDGVITSSSRQHFLAWKQMAYDEFNKYISDEVEDMVRGVSRMDSLDIVLKNIEVQNQVSDLKKEELATAKNNIYISLISQFDESNLFKGTVELFERLKNECVLIALGSASKNSAMLLEKMKIKKYFDYAVDPADIPAGRGKPEPDIFLKAADGLKIEPALCVGVEDAYSGVTAIKRAGMTAIGIGDNAYLNHADIVYKEIGDIDIVQVDKLL